MFPLKMSVYIEYKITIERHSFPARSFHLREQQFNLKA